MCCPVCLSNNLDSFEEKIECLDCGHIFDPANASCECKKDDFYDYEDDDDEEDDLPDYYQDKDLRY